MIYPRRRLPGAPGACSSAGVRGPRGARSRSSILPPRADARRRGGASAGTGGRARSAARDPYCGIADDGVADRREVGADLVGAAGLEADVEQRFAGQPLATSKWVTRRTRAAPADHDAAPGHGGRGRAARRSCRSARAGSPRPGRRTRGVTSRAAIIALSARVRLGAAGDDQQPRRVLVEPMDDPGAVAGRRRRQAASPSASTSEGPGLPGAGWTTRPAGLSTTARRLVRPDDPTARSGSTRPRLRPCRPGGPAGSGSRLAERVDQDQDRRPRR